MTTVTYEQDLELSVQAVWEVLKDFGGFLKWAGGGRGTIEVEGEGVGMMRSLNIPGLGLIQERVEILDPETKTLSYRLVGGQPLGMASYLALVRLIDGGDGACRIAWHGEFEGAEGTDASEIAVNLEGSYVGMSKGLVAYVKGG